ncbi:MAG: YigZ family protein [Anaerolineales bacterium]
MEHSYQIPLSQTRREMTVVNSRFIATLAPALNIEEARAFIAKIKKEFADARHNVPTYIIGGGNTVTEYFSDDGEPSGTAGKPALAVLRGSGLGDAALVVTRYFGGTLLGTGGLVKAYTEAAQMAVEAAPRGRRISVRVALLAIPYHLLERVRRAMLARGAENLGEEFAADVTITLRIPVDRFAAFQSDLRELSAGAIQAEVIEDAEAVVAI